MTWFSPLASQSPQVTEDAWANVDAFIAAADYRFMPEREGLTVSKIAVSLMKFLGSS